MRVLVCGGRDYADREFLYEMLDLLHKKYTFTLLIHGAAHGADKMADDWAILNKIPRHPHQAEWTLYGKGAGPIRNRKMLREERPQLVVAFEGEKGTPDMCQIARKALVNVLHFK